MKRSTLLFIFTAIMMNLVGCATTSTTTTTTTTSSPELAGYTQPTSRMPSPGNYRATNVMQSTTMRAPSY